MEERLAGLAAGVVGTALAAVAAAEYVLPGYPPPPMDPFATGLLVSGGGSLLFVAGMVAVLTSRDAVSLRAATAVGVATLALAVLQPGSLLFGGVFWLGLVSTALIGAGAYRTVTKTR